MPREMKEYPFHYVILRYMPDFARDEFVNGGIILHEAHDHSILGKVCKERSKYSSVDSQGGGYKTFIEASEALLADLIEEVAEINQTRKGIEAAISVEKAFLNKIIPNAGFLQYSDIRSGITDNITEKFRSLYKRYVDDSHGQVPDREDNLLSERKSRIIDLFLHKLKAAPYEYSFPYGVTRGSYLFDISFGDPQHVYLKTVRVKPKKNGTVEWGNVLQSLAVLSDLKVSHPKYTFGILLDFLYKTVNIDREKKLSETIASIATRFRQSKVDLVMANRRDVENYLVIKGLLKT